MIGEVTGIRRVRRLDLQLTYRCSSECRLCRQGELLGHADAFTAEQAVALLSLMHEEYGTQAVAVCGGELFAQGELGRVVRHAKRELRLRVEVGTDGYRIERWLAEISPYVDLLGISLDGLGPVRRSVHQSGRPGRPGSALRAFELARAFGVRTGATMRVTSRNLDEVLPLARTAEELGARRLTLRCPRPLGHAANHPGILTGNSAAYARLRRRLREALAIEVVVEEDPPDGGGPGAGSPAGGPAEVERIEADPRGALTVSSTAAGQDSHAFWYDKLAGRIVHRPVGGEEFTLAGV